MRPLIQTGTPERRDMMNPTFLNLARRVYHAMALFGRGLAGL